MPAATGGPSMNQRTSKRQPPAALACCLSTVDLPMPGSLSKTTYGNAASWLIRSVGGRPLASPCKSVTRRSTAATGLERGMTS